MIKTSNRNYFRSIYQKNFRKKFVMENKLSLSDRRDKSMHYPESPKVTRKQCYDAETEKCPKQQEKSLFLWTIFVRKKNFRP